MSSGLLSKLWPTAQVSRPKRRPRYSARGEDTTEQLVVEEIETIDVGAPPVRGPRARKRKSRPAWVLATKIGWSLLAALLIVGALLWYLFSNNDLSERKIIYVTGSVVNVREGPSTGFPVVTKLKKGHKLVELSRDGDWVNITLEGTIAKTAWIHASLVSAEPQAEKSP